MERKQMTDEERKLARAEGDRLADEYAAKHGCKVTDIWFHGFKPVGHTTPIAETN